MYKINALEQSLQCLTDDMLKAKTEEFRARLRRGATPDDLLVEAFAVVREVSSRVLRLRHFDAQLVRSRQQDYALWQKTQLLCWLAPSSINPYTAYQCNLQLLLHTSALQSLHVF